MEWLTEIRRRRPLRRIEAALGRAVTTQDRLAGHPLPHLANVAAVAERLAATDSAWALRVVVPVLAGDLGLATRAAAAGDAALRALTERLVGAHVDALSRAALSRVRVPQGCSLAATKLQLEAAAALRTADDDRTIVTALANLVRKKPEVCVEGAAEWMAAEESRVRAAVFPATIGPLPAGLALDLEKCQAALRERIRETFFEEVDTVAWFAQTSRQSRLTRIAATLGRTPRPGDGLDRLSVTHVSGVAAVAERLAGTVWGFREILPRLVSDEAFAACTAASTDAELLAEVNTIIAGRAEALAKAAFADVGGRMPSMCRADIAKLQPAAAAALVTGKDDGEIVISLASLVRKSPEAYVEYAVGWIEEEASRVLGAVRPALAKWIPRGLELDSEKCLTVLRGRIRETFFQEADAAKWFTSRFEAAPDDYILGIAAWYEEGAAAAFKALRPALERDLPPGCSIREPVCLEAIVQLLRKRTPMVELPARFAEVVNAEPARFIQGLRELLHARATEIFRQIKPSLAGALPPSCGLIESACVELVERLINEPVPPAKLVERFVAALGQSPPTYIRGLPTPSMVRSGAPYRPSASGARL